MKLMNVKVLSLVAAAFLFAGAAHAQESAAPAPGMAQPAAEQNAKPMKQKKHKKEKKEKKKKKSKQVKSEASSEAPVSEKK